ncbi:MAG: hypothetical protein KC729_15330, partial [Candidatus Eisenbacteria bacterium]|nr:hypothetical protein [Candidatus Eisenbacteria bacterium]
MPDVGERRTAEDAEAEGAEPSMSMESTDSYKRLYLEQQFLVQLGRDLERVSLRTPDSHLLRIVLRRLGEALEADLAVQTDVRHPQSRLERPYRLDLSSPIDEAICAPLLRDFDDAGARILAGQPLGPLRREMLVFAIEADDRLLAIYGFLRQTRLFNRTQLHFGQDVVRLVCDRLVARERERERSLREKISTKIFSELRPKDVLYQILHGLRKLFRYDHSGTVLLLGPDRRTLTVQAEIVVWTKAKSERIGEQIRLDEDLAAWLEADEHRSLLVRDGVALTPPGYASHGAYEPPERLRQPLLAPPAGSPAARSM